jgi:hypothetical protein
LAEVPGSAVNEAVALEANHWFRDLLAKLSHNSPVAMTPQVTYKLDVARHPRGWGLLSSIAGHDLDLFKLHAYSVVAGQRTGLKLCARCAKIFLPHGRQNYCSKRCSGNERKARWRKKPSDTSASS